MRTRNVVFWFAVAIFVAWSIVVLIKNVQDDASSVAKTPISASSLPPNGAMGASDLRLDAWVDDSRVVPGETINYWLAVTNASASDVTRVSVLAFRRSNFIAVVSPGCWDDKHKVPLCSDKGLLPQPLKKGEVLTIEGQLRASGRTGKSGVGAVIGWSDSNGYQHRKPIRIDPVTIENAEKSAYLHALATFRSILRDLALPLAGALVTFLLKKFEDTRDKTRRMDSDRRAQVQQTWTLMLPKMHENSERYYMPLMTYAASVEKYYDGVHADAELCFFFYLAYLAHMKQMVDRISGFYLRDRAGEDVVSTIWGLLLDRADARFTRVNRELAQVVFLTRTNLTYAEFKEGPAKSPAVTAVRTKFVNPAVYSDFIVDVKLLKLFYLALTYEVNRSYQFWYIDAEEFPAAEWLAVYDDVGSAHGAGLVPDKEFSTLLTALDMYATSVDRRAYNVQ